MSIFELRMIVDNANQIFYEVENITQDGILIAPENLPRHEKHVYEFDFMQMVVDGPETGLQKQVHWRCEGIIHNLII
jgi:hypothetical protein